jgi:hypothetical protein
MAEVGPWILKYTLWIISNARGSWCNSGGGSADVVTWLSADFWLVRNWRDAVFGAACSPCYCRCMRKRQPQAMQVAATDYASVTVHAVQIQ